MSELTMIQKYKNRITKNHCPRCKAKLENNIIKTPLLGLVEATGKMNKHFYGGNVKRFSLTECDSCGAEILLYLKAVNNGWRIHDVGIEDRVLTADFNVSHNEIEVDVPVTAETTPIELGEAIESEDEDADTMTNESLDDMHINDLMTGIHSLDIDKSIAALNQLTYGKVPKTLEAAGIPHKVVYNEKGRCRKKAEYVQIVTDHIMDAIQNIASDLHEAKEE